MRNRQKTNANLNDFPMVSSYNERGVLISGCTFKNSIPMTTPFFDLSMRNRAIYSEDAGFRIQNSSFSGYKEAINIGNYSNSPLRNVKVMNCTFDSVNTGIIFADNFSYAQGNTFDNLLNYVYTGGTIAYLYEGQAIYANTTGGLTVTTNTIRNTGNNPNTRGITVSNSAASGGRVIDNIINQTRLGVITQQNNPALDLLCNRFTDVAYSFVINPQSASGVLKNQGNGCGMSQYRAGNTFQGTSTTQISSYVTTPWSYYYWAGSPTQVPTSVTGSVTNAPCFSIFTDPNSQCNLPGNVESAVERMNDEAFYTWPVQIVGPMQAQTTMEFAAIVNRFNEQGDAEGLVRFLEAMNHVEARKLLLPLYLELERYSAFDKMLHSIDLPEEEAASYRSYYAVLKTLKQEKRSIYELNAEELAMVKEIAAGNTEISARAKSLMEFAYQQPWHHYQEQMPVRPFNTSLETGAFKSTLSDAVPNPAKTYALVEVNWSLEDGAQAVLTLRNMMGQTVRSYPLTEAGAQGIRVDLLGLPEGVYIYSLQVGGKILQSKRLVTVQ